MGVGGDFNCGWTPSSRRQERYGDTPGHLSFRSAMRLAAASVIGLGVIGGIGARPALAGSTESVSKDVASGESAASAPKPRKPPAANGLVSARTLSKSVVTPKPAALSAAQFDAVYGWKGWNVPFPSFGNTILQDAGGFRTRLAELGFGFFIWNDNGINTPLLDGPRQGPRYHPFYRSYQNYNGQKVTASSAVNLYLTYDLGRAGLPGGQFQVEGSLVCSTFQGYLPCGATVTALSYYQAMFDQRLEFQAGVFPLQMGFIGAYVAGNVSNTLGPGAQPLTLAGLSTYQAVTPAASLKVNVTDQVYVQAAVARSLGVGGPSGDLYFDTTQNNLKDLGWNGNAPATHELYIGEAGYKTAAAPGQFSSWYRGGGVYNNSEFQDLARLTIPGAPRVSGNSAYYFLFDQQFWQQSPSTIAARGLYIGGTATYADPTMTAITQSYDAKLYWIGPLDSRPGDIASLIVGYQVNSPHLIDAVNSGSLFTGTYGARDRMTVTATYLARLGAGVHGRVSVNYLTSPTVTYFGPSLANPGQPFMGSALIGSAALSLFF